MVRDQPHYTWQRHWAIYHLMHWSWSSFKAKALSPQPTYGIFTGTRPSIMLSLVGARRSSQSEWNCPSNMPVVSITHHAMRLITQVCTQQPSEGQNCLKFSWIHQEWMWIAEVSLKGLVTLILATIYLLGESMKLLLENKANVHQRDQEGKTVHWYVCNWDLSMVEDKSSGYRWK